MTGQDQQRPPQPPEYRAESSNGEVLGSAVVTVGEDGFEVTMYAPGREPLTHSRLGEDEAHAFARTYAEGLVERARTALRAQFGTEPDGQSYEVQQTGGDYIWTLDLPPRPGHGAC